LTSPEKAKRTEMAKSVPAELARHEASNSRFLFTGDESWISYATPSPKTQTD
jgi:hypothetical protein